MRFNHYLTPLQRQILTRIESGHRAVEAAQMTGLRKRKLLKRLGMAHYELTDLGKALLADPTVKDDPYVVDA